MSDHSHSTRIRYSTILLIVLILSASRGYGEEIDVRQGCKTNPKLVGPCFQLHGRLTITNGTPGVRIWRIGTRRILGVSPSEDEIMPANLKQHLGLGTFIYGDFEVCPFTLQKKGEMQLVCVENARRLVLEKYENGKKKPIVKRLNE